MQITDTKIVSIPLSQLVCNEGQIEGVPANPRILRDDKYRALVESLRNDNLTGINPLKVYWHSTDGANKLYVVLGGNMRLRALQDLGAAECPCIEIPQDTPTEVLRKIVVLDNSTFGEWDWDMLANEWDETELKEWGVDLPEFETPKTQEEEKETPQSKHNGSEIIVANVTLFGQTNETILCAQISDEQAERLLEAVKKDGADSIINKMLQ